MLNLLPTEERHTSRNEERLRFFSVVALFGAFVAGLSTLVLVPSLSVLILERTWVTREYTALDKEIKAQEQDSMLTLFETDTRALQRALEEPVPSAFFTLIRAKQKEGITLDTLTYKRRPAQIVVTGVARGREDLVAFAHALEAVPEFTSVVLPVSGLAKNVDIPFTLSLLIRENPLHSL